MVPGHGVSVEISPREAAGLYGLGRGMEIRFWHRGMLFRFILYLRRHHHDFRVGGGEWGLGPGTGACRLGSYFAYGGTSRILGLETGHED